jgi:hypothetical protein
MRLTVPEKSTSFLQPKNQKERREKKARDENDRIGDFVCHDSLAAKPPGRVRRTRDLRGWDHKRVTWQPTRSQGGQSVCHPTRGWGSGKDGAVRPPSSPE